jgi:hypothetical protein
MGHNGTLWPRGKGRGTAPPPAPVTRPRALHMDGHALVLAPMYRDYSTILILSPEVLRPLVFNMGREVVEPPVLVYTDASFHWVLDRGHEMPHAVLGFHVIDPVTQASRSTGALRYPSNFTRTSPRTCAYTSPRPSC